MVPSRFYSWTILDEKARIHALWSLLVCLHAPKLPKNPGYTPTFSGPPWRVQRLWLLGFFTLETRSLMVFGLWTPLHHQPQPIATTNTCWSNPMPVCSRSWCNVLGFIPFVLCFFLRAYAFEQTRFHQNKMLFEQKYKVVVPFREWNKSLFSTQEDADYEAPVTDGMCTNNNIRFYVKLNHKCESIFWTITSSTHFILYPLTAAWCMLYS